MIRYARDGSSASYPSCSASASWSSADPSHPGNPAISILGERATPELVERVRNQLGLDLPCGASTCHFLGNLSRGTSAPSYFYKQEVTTLTLERIPITLALIGYAALIGSSSRCRSRRWRRSGARGSSITSSGSCSRASSGSRRSGWASSYPSCSA
jgi:hypothetical protein